MKRFIKYFDGQTKLLIKNSSWVLGGNLFRAVMMFVKSIVISRGLGVELFGVFNLIAAFAILIHQFLQFTLGSVIIKFGADFLGQNKQAKFQAFLKAMVGTSLVLGFISNLIIIGATFLFYDVFFDRPNLQLYIILFGLVSSTAFIDVPSIGLLRLFYKFKQRSIIDIIKVALELAVVAIVLYLYPKNFKYFFIALVGVRLVGSIIFNTSAWFILSTQIGQFWKAKVTAIQSEKSEIINFTLSNTGSRILKNLSNNGDVLLLGALSGPSAVAFYNIAKKLAQTILILVDPIANTLFPQLSHLISQRKFGEIQLMISKVSKLLVVPLILIMGGLYLFRVDVIQLTYGSDFLPAAKPFIYLAANAILSALLFWNLPMILSMGLVQFRFWTEAVFLLLGVVLAYLTVPSMGASGVALGLLVTSGGAQTIFAITTYTKSSKEAKHAT
ncbi:MAG: oligosaccharide flippase family protein [Vicingaceae bacterium]